MTSNHAPKAEIIGAAFETRHVFARGPKHTCGRELILETENGQLVERCSACRYSRIVPRRPPAPDERGDCRQPSYSRNGFPIRDKYVDDREKRRSA